MSLARLYITISFCLILNGCIVVPLGELSKSPYPTEVRHKLSQKGTDKNLVRKTLGTPSAIKSKGRYWFDTNARDSLGVIGSSSSTVFQDYEWLGIQFDEFDFVTFFEYNDDIPGCLTNEICIQKYNALGSQPVITAQKVEDTEAKSYLVKADECAVYLFLKFLPWPGIGPGQSFSLKFFAKGKSIGHSDEETYLFLKYPRGDISISAFQFTMTTKCLGGETQYIRAVVGRDWSKRNGEDLSPVSADEGKAEIRARRLALPD
jgi:hypothetical protein